MAASENQIPDNKTIRKMKLKLTTVTPVSIGDDQAKSLSPYADYIFSENGSQLLYLNPDVIKKSFEKDGKINNDLIDEYVSIIEGSMNNNRSEFDLENFVQNKLGLDLEKSDVVIRRVNVQGLEMHRKEQVSPMLKSAGRLYIPGSTIKGAIRTSILYDWLVKSPQGAKVIKFLRGDLDRVGQIKRKNPNFRRMSFNDRKELRRLERNFFPEVKLFGSIRSKFGPDARRIRVSDTNQTDDGLEVHALKRIRLKPLPQRGNRKYGRGSGGQKSEIPIIREAIQSNAIFECKVNILKGFESPILRYWEEKSPAEIFKLLNGFTIASLGNEIFELENSEGGKFGQEINQLLDFYQQLRTRAKNGEVFLRLGFGKTIYDNSLALSMLNGIDDEDDALDAFDTYRQSFWRMNRHARTYPATRTTTQDGMPMGWVKVEAV